jgi:ribonuclease P protein component
VRNRVKRLLREATRLKQGEITDRWDLVFIARSPISAARFSEVTQAVDNLLRRACLLKAPLHPSSMDPNPDSSKQVR